MRAEGRSYSAVQKASVKSFTIAAVAGVYFLCSQPGAGGNGHRAKMLAAPRDCRRTSRNDGMPVPRELIGYSSVDRLIEVVEDKIVRRAETKFNQLLERRNSKLRVEIV
jgi:hypothetical protein